MRFLNYAAALLASSVLLGHAAPLTIAQAFNPEGVSQAALSPDGKSVALLFFDGTKYELQFYFVNTDITRAFELFGEVKEVESGKVVTPQRVTWAGNNLLALDYGSLAISVNRYGRLIAELGNEVIRRAELGDSDSPWLLVYTDATHNEIALVNAESGEKKILSHPPGKLGQAAFDRHGEMRAVTLLDTDKERGVSAFSNWYLPAPGMPWQKLAEFGVNDERWMPAYVMDKPNTLAVYSRVGRDTYAYFAYDTERKAIGEMLAGHPSEDILGVRGAEKATYEQVVTGGMRSEYVWLNGAWAGVQKSVDAVLPGRVNLLSGNPRDKVLVYSYSDVQPGEWHLLDKVKGTMRRLVQSRPATAGVDMRPMEIMRYTAPDGLSIPAFLTRPTDGAKNTPLVVLIHGGPWVRDYWGWDEEVQLLAAQGYTVIQPQFRGSTGFGKHFEEAGYGQWGLAMQDDITAGVRHLIAQGIADPARICIVGSSYGGYAALWGLAKTPELYQCGISFAGVADIEFMFHDDSDRAGSKLAHEILMKRIGDVAADPQHFDQVSPLKHADRIRAPVLLMHGEDDQRVPISHGLQMKEALESRGKQVEWLSFAHEGHGLYYLSTTTKYHQAMLTFLDKYIGKRSVAPAADPKEH
jgi:dipeptidyl aminopeptidase/acylaminoacyl peptidase